MREGDLVSVRIKMPSKTEMAIMYLKIAKGSLRKAYRQLGKPQDLREMQEVINDVDDLIVRLGRKNYIATKEG